VALAKRRYSERRRGTVVHADRAGYHLRKKASGGRGKGESKKGEGARVVLKPRQATFSALMERHRQGTKGVGGPGFRERMGVVELIGGTSDQL